MGSQKPKKDAQEKPQEVQPAVQKEKTIKKWKGKDWFTFVSPALFGSKDIGDTPATDPKSLSERNIEVSLAELTGNPSKYTMKVKLHAQAIEGNKILTRFNGLYLIKEQIFRIVRKRASKIEIVCDVETKDQWLLHLKVFAILNKSSNAEIQKKIRLQTIGFLKDFSSKAPVKDVIKTACDGLIQKNIKKFGSKTYPIRFCEIIKMEVLKAGKLD